MTVDLQNDASTRFTVIIQMIHTMIYINMIRLYDTPPSIILHTQLNSMIQVSCDPGIMGECESLFMVCWVVFTQRESTAIEVWFSPLAMCVEDTTGPMFYWLQRIGPNVVLLLLSRNARNRSDVETELRLGGPRLRFQRQVKSITATRRLRLLPLASSLRCLWTKH